MMFCFEERWNIMLGSLEAKAGRFRIDMALCRVVLLILTLVGNSMQDLRSCGNDDNPISAGDVILSPRYPDPAWNPMNCIWTVQAKAGMHVKLRYSKLDIGGPKEDCDHGALFIYDGCGKDRFLVEKICSSKFKPERENLWISWGSCLTVQFTSTTGTTNSFVLTTNKISGSCGGNLVTSNQTFSPSMSLYPEARLCVWIIDARQKGTIELRFDETFDIGWNNGKGCENNYVKVKGGRFSSSKTLGTYCGNTRPYTVTSQGRYLRVTMLVTDITNYAFTARYSFLDGKRHTTSEDCGYSLDGRRGEIVSPGYPHQYPARLQCTWSIKLAKEHKVSLTFEDFDIESYSNDACPVESDYVEINNGLGSWSPTIGRFCGKSLPRPVQSDSNEMRVYFKSDDHYGGRGFKAIYEIYTENESDSNSTGHFTGIMIGTTCGIIFVVLGTLAVFHTRKMRLRRAQSDAISMRSFDFHQANALPSYETVTTFPERFPSSCAYSEPPHLHREISHLLGEHEWDEVGPPTYEDVMEGGAIIHQFDRHNSIPETERTGEQQSGSKDDGHVTPVWYRRASPETPKGPPGLAPNSGCTTDV